MMHKFAAAALPGKPIQVIDLTKYIVQVISCGSYMTGEQRHDCREFVWTLFKTKDEWDGSSKWKVFGLFSTVQLSCGLCWRRRKSKTGWSTQSFGLCPTRCAIMWTLDKTLDKWWDWLSHWKGLTYLGRLNIFKTKAPAEWINQMYTGDQGPQSVNYQFSSFWGSKEGKLYNFLVQKSKKLDLASADQTVQANSQFIGWSINMQPIFGDANSVWGIYMKKVPIYLNVLHKLSAKDFLGQRKPDGSFWLTSCSLNK